MVIWLREDKPLEFHDSAQERYVPKTCNGCGILWRAYSHSHSTGGYINVQMNKMQEGHVDT